jgi:hypothetical protein
MIIQVRLLQPTSPGHSSPEADDIILVPVLHLRRVGQADTATLGHQVKLVL